MTSTVARRVKACFTTRMKQTAPAKTKRETIYAKAERLMAEGGRVEAIRAEGTSFWIGIVRGDHGSYTTMAVSQEFMDLSGISGGRIGCNCRSGRKPQLCAHALMAEEMRLQGEQS